MQKSDLSHLSPFSRKKWSKLPLKKVGSFPLKNHKISFSITTDWNNQRERVGLSSPYCPRNRLRWCYDLRQNAQTNATLHTWCNYRITASWIVAKQSGKVSFQSSDLTFWTPDYHWLNIWASIANEHGHNLLVEAVESAKCATEVLLDFFTLVKLYYLAQGLSTLCLQGPTVPSTRHEPRMARGNFHFQKSWFKICLVDNLRAAKFNPGA